MTPEQAIRIVALQVIAAAAEGVSENGWENYPEIGEHDWDSVVEEVKEIARWPEAADYRKAYAVLTAWAGATNEPLTASSLTQKATESTFYEAEEKP